MAVFSKLLWTVEEAGEVLGLNPEGVRHLVKTGQLQAKKRHAHALMFTWDQLQAYVDSLPDRAA